MASITCSELQCHIRAFLLLGNQPAFHHFDSDFEYSPSEEIPWEPSDGSEEEHEDSEEEREGSEGVDYYDPDPQNPGDCVVLHPSITPSSIALVQSALPVPLELTIPILDFAEYWAETHVTSSRRAGVEDKTIPFLTTPPIEAGRLRKIVVTTVSKDQGWSSYPEHHGTYDGSWTWFELSLNAPPTEDNKRGEEKHRCTIVRNVHAQDELKEHVLTIEDDAFYAKAEPGDTFTVWAAVSFTVSHACS